MAYILNIDTTTEIATVCLSKGDEVIHSLQNDIQYNHASFLHTSINSIIGDSGLEWSEINAIAVSAGPGSYTGIRVGMAAAKGLCYALGIPFILLNTLEIIALSATLKLPSQESLYCPMIDARRMEVFTAIYDFNLNEIVTHSALILQGNSFQSLLQNNTVFFVGSGSRKFSEIVKNNNARFVEGRIEPKALSIISSGKYQKLLFSDVALSEPLYIKQFQG